MRKARAIVFAAALVALLLVIFAGPGTKHDWWNYRIGLGMLQFGAYIGMAAAVAALVLVILLAVPKWRLRPWVPLVTLIVALLAVAPPLILRHEARSVPPIHDITTDPADPPAFVALQAERQKAPNGVAYGGPEIAAQQQSAYADIKPLILKAPPEQALQRAIDAARSLGWQVVSSDAASGRIDGHHVLVRVQGRRRRASAPRCVGRKPGGRAQRFSRGPQRPRRERRARAQVPREARLELEIGPPPSRG